MNLTRFKPETVYILFKLYNDAPYEVENKEGVDVEKYVLPFYLFMFNYRMEIIHVKDETEEVLFHDNNKILTIKTTAYV